MGPFKKGGFHLAMDAGVPIVPVAVVGGFHVLPAHSLRVRPGSMQVRLGEPINTSSFQDLDLLMEEVRRRIEGLVYKERPSPTP
jgi:1-acyl-sn-glycerol-3-phosphate acyltransferase